MSNKHFRRVAKDDGLALSAAAEPPHSENSSESEEELGTKPVNKFSLLCDDSDLAPSELSEVDEEKEVLTKAVKVRKPKKKNKKKEKNSRADEHNDIALADAITKSLAVTANLKESVMKIDSRYLDPDAELRRLLGRTFGPAALAAGRKVPHVRVPRGSRLVKVQPNWPTTGNFGLSMIMCGDDGGVKSFRFKHNVEYQELQQMFWNFQAHMDFDNIANTVLAVNPFHLDSLLLMAENMRIHEDTQAAINILEMGIFACERVFHSAFRPFAADCRLLYDWWENRAFFLLLHRYVLSLIQRNCFTTALEFVKIIYIRDDNDPLAVLLLIDSLALRAKNFKFLVDFYDAFKESKNLDMLPNFLYSMALANFFLSESDESYAVSAENFMILALSRFPFILGQVLDKLQIQADSAVENNYLLNTQAFYRETEGLRLISDIYLHHSLELWRQPNVLSWLEQTTHKILPRLSNADNLRSTVDAWRRKRKQCFIGVPRNVLRHTHIHSIRHNVSVPDSRDDASEVDPYPPNSQADYVPEMAAFRAVVGTRESNPDAAVVGGNPIVDFMRTLIPDEIQPQIQQFGDALRGYVTNFVDRIARRD